MILQVSNALGIFQFLLVSEASIIKCAHLLVLFACLKLLLMMSCSNIIYFLGLPSFPQEMVCNFPTSILRIVIDLSASISVGINLVAKGKIFKNWIFILESH